MNGGDEGRREMTQPSTPLPPAGWYRDPLASNDALRYWDGAAWTGIDVPEVVPEPTPQVGSSWVTYWTDLQWSAKTLWASPYFVLISVGLLVVVDLGARQIIRPTAVAGLLTLAVEVFLIGFVGAQRVWFWRKLNGANFEASEAWTMPWRFFGRFLCLGLLGTIFALPIFIPLVGTTDRSHEVTAGTVHISTWITVAVVIWAALADVAGTFVVPALALNVHSVRSALAVGWRLTRRTWPVNAWYIFAPGFTVVALAAVLPRTIASTGVYLLVGIFSALVNLLFKGALVPFYVRSLHPASPDGSAYD